MSYNKCYITNIGHVVSEGVPPLGWGSTPSGLRDQVPLHSCHLFQVVQEELKHLNGNPRG